MKYKSFLDDPDWKFDWKQESEKTYELTFPNGSVIELCYSSPLKDAYRSSAERMLISANRRANIHGFEWVLEE